MSTCWLSASRSNTILLKCIVFTVYILRTNKNTLYIGQTNNLEKRIKEHKSKSPKAAKYTRYFKTFKLVYSEKHPTRGKAMQKEIQLKKLSKTEKEAIIQGENAF